MRPAGSQIHYDACEAICEYIEECCGEESFYLGDIAISFAEIAKEDVEEYDEENIIAELPNGNVVISQ